VYGFRYHLITVIAIFLALTIGLLLGASLGRSGSADAPTDSMVSSLQQSFDAITQENGRTSCASGRAAAWRGRMWSS
jgi:hypothetical protein